jgi:hypothetical protein
MGSNPGQFMSPVLPPSEKKTWTLWQGNRDNGRTVGSLKKMGPWKCDRDINGSILFLPKLVSWKTLLTTGDVHRGRTHPGSSLMLLLARVRVQSNLCPHYSLCKKNFGIMTTMGPLKWSVLYRLQCRVSGLLVVVFHNNVWIKII